MFFATQSKLLIGGAMLFVLLLAIGSYFDTHWYYGEVAPVPAHLLAVGPHRPKANQEAPIAAAQNTESLETLTVPEPEGLSASGRVSTPLPNKTEAELATLLQDWDPFPFGQEDFPEIPEGFPADLSPVWVQYPDYQSGNMSYHEMIDRVLIKLWNQGDHDFVDGVYRDGRVYPIYPDVVYVEWSNEVIDGPDGETGFRSMKSTFGTHTSGYAETDAVEQLFTMEEMISGAYRTKYPGLRFVNYEDGGYNPKTFLDDE